MVNTILATLWVVIICRVVLPVLILKIKPIGGTIVWIIRKLLNIRRERVIVARLVRLIQSDQRA